MPSTSTELNPRHGRNPCICVAWCTSWAVNALLTVFNFGLVVTDEHRANTRNSLLPLLAVRLLDQDSPMNQPAFAWQKSPARLVRKTWFGNEFGKHSLPQIPSFAQFVRATPEFKMRFPSISRYSTRNTDAQIAFMRGFESHRGRIVPTVESARYFQILSIKPPDSISIYQ